MENKNIGLGILVGVLVVLTIGMSTFIVYDKFIAKGDKDVQKENQTQNNKEEVEPDNCVKEVPKCYGTYYGEASGTYDGISTYNLKYTYELKEDGTFTADYSGVSSTKGTFVINGNTISLTGMKEIAGPEETHYSTGDYIIADDCSYILFDSEKNFKLFKQ